MTIAHLAVDTPFDPDARAEALVDGAMRRARLAGGEEAVDNILHCMLWAIIYQQVVRDGAQLTLSGLEDAAQYAHSDLEKLHG